MTRRQPALALAAGLFATTAVAGEGEDWPRETIYDGPMRFCSSYFAIEVAQGESARVSDPGLDFLVTYFGAQDRWLGIYQGEHPQQGERVRRVRLIPGTRVDRMTDREGTTSYLIHATPGASLPVYLHIFSDQFTGADEDRAILGKVAFGSFGETGCTGPTYDPAKTE